MSHCEYIDRYDFFGGVLLAILCLYQVFVAAYAFCKWYSWNKIEKELEDSDHI